jgi:hypothetical protein
MANPGPNVVSPAIVRGSAIISLPVTFTSGQVAASTVTEIAFTLNGLKTGDWVSVNPTKAVGTDMAITYAYVSAANTIKIAFAKTSAGTGTPAADTYLVNVVRSDPDQSDFGITGFNNYGIVAASDP